MSRKKKGEAWGENGFEDWGGYMAAKVAKLEEQFQNEADKGAKTSNIFQGVSIFVNGYTDPTADELRRLMMVHGGTYHHYMRPRVTTHIIASNLPYSKIVLYRKSQNPIPICKPEWIVDSIKAGSLLNFQNYLLYSQCTDVQPQLNYVIKDKKKEMNSTTAPVQNDTEKNYGTSLPKNVNRDKPTPMNINSTNPPGPAGPRVAQCSKDSEFISEFYSHSRLHHIATMGATFKDYVNQLRDKSNGSFPGLSKLKEFSERKVNRSLSDSQLGLDTEAADILDENKVEAALHAVIMHIDMDCFFVSVGLRDKPHLKGLPVAVTHAKGNKNSANNNKQTLDSNSNRDEEHGSLSEVASCSYEARKAGVKNGMFLGEALKICPNLKTIPYDFEGYTEVSYTLYDTVASYTLNIEAVSCDEMYADCTKILAESCLTPMEFASIIRQEIKEKTGCPVSTGFGSNKLLARLATRKAKPNGQFFIQQEQIKECIGSFDVQDLPGVGWTTAHKLNGMNVRTCAELQAVSLTTLQRVFGRKNGEILYNMCRGIDSSKLNLEHVRKSVSAEVNYGIRFESNEDAIDFLRKLSEEVCNRLHKAHAKGRCITLKLLVRAKEAPKETEKFMGHGLCDYMTKSKNLISPVNDVNIITKEVVALWNQMQRVPEDARGIGIQISRLEILKNKSRDATLMSFVKNKQNSNTHDRTNDTHKTNDSDVPVTSAIVPSISENAEDVCGEQKLRVLPGIDESVMNELPEEIRNEILKAARENGMGNINKAQEVPRAPRVEEKKPEKNIQTQHERFFKQTKPGVSRSTKVEMPSIQEIDMAVLIELPEDIRNEILNEYSNKRNENQTNGNTKQTNAPPTATHEINPMEKNCDEQNISFSQVDPEFLAALSDDLKRDVQMYCSAKKSENCAKMKKVEINRNPASTKSETAKPSKKVEQNTKSKGFGKNNKGPARSKKKSIRAAFKTVKTVSNDKDNKSNDRVSNDIPKSVILRAEKFESVKSQVPVEEAEAILSHNRTISENKNTSNQPDDILIDLVNRLLYLPVQQVKMQIQMWITNSKVVNEVDFLSLATFLSMLPERRRIEDLHVLLKTMHRCMTKTGNCIWHRTYRKTVKYVQHYMQIEYNSNLMVPPVKCNLVWCNSDVM